MTAIELRELQRPLKLEYQENPSSAIVAFRSRAVLSDDISADVHTPKGIVRAGLHPATGGSGEFLCSGDMLLEALSACAAVTLNSVATAMEIQLRHAEVIASADLDFRGTLGVDRTTPVGFSHITMEFVLDTDAPREKIDTLIKLTERYCVVFQTLAVTPKIDTVISHES